MHSGVATGAKRDQVLLRIIARLAAKFLVVKGLVDHAHSATTNLLDDAVVRDGLTDELGGSGHWRDVRSDTA